MDPATLIAAAVVTVRAQMTEEALRNPSPTPTATDTPTPPPTVTPTLPPSATPTVTATTAPALSAKFLSAGTFPENKLIYKPNEKFGLAVRFKNTGTADWDGGYRLKLVGAKGEITVQTELALGHGIKPGESAEFDLWAFGSETLGTHIFYFQLYSSAGVPVPGGAASFAYTSE